MARNQPSPAASAGVTSIRSNEAEPLGLATGQQLKFAWISMICGMIWTLYLLLASRGVLHGDALTHFVISREAWHVPRLLLDHWARPVDTVLYMVPARLGLVYARLTTLMVAALIVLTAFLLARELRIGYAFVVPLLLWFQPWFLRWAVQPSMTETPFSLMLVLSAFLFVSNRVVLASAVIALFPLIRLEALALTAVWVVVCVWRRAWIGAIVASLPIIVYGAVYHAVFGELPDSGFPLNPLLLLAHHVPYVPHHQPWRIYRWLSYPKLLVLGTGLPIAALALYGFPRLTATPARVAVLAWYGLYAAVHIVLFRLGIEGYAEERYWLPLAPLVSISGALGLEMLAGRIHAWLPFRGALRASSTRLGNVILALTITAAVVVGLFVSPTPADPAEDTARDALAWLRQERLTDAPILSASNVWFLYLLGHLPSRGTRDTLSDWPQGSIAVWDNELSDYWGIPWADLSSDRKWRLLKTFEAGKARVVIFQKQLP